jgi:hypothetical protein
MPEAVPLHLQEVAGPDHIMADRVLIQFRQDEALKADQVIPQDLIIADLPLPLTEDLPLQVQNLEDLTHLQVLIPDLLHQVHQVLHQAEEDRSKT